MPDSELVSTRNRYVIKSTGIKGNWMANKYILFVISDCRLIKVPGNIQFNKGGATCSTFPELNLFGYINIYRTKAVNRMAKKANVINVCAGG